MAKIEITRTAPFELLNHEDLADMPDTAGTNLDHDARYYTETEIDTMLSDGTIDHLNLSNIGVNTHAQIDTHIADLTIHFTEASIDHTAILNIGVNTHAQIDTHIADVLTNPHSVTYTQVGAIQDANDTVNDTHIDWGLGANQVSTTDMPEGVNLYFTDERAQDAVGTILVDSSTIDFTYNDVANTITADVIPGGINLNDLGDVNAPAPADNDSLTWDTATSRWIPEAVVGAGEANTASNTGSAGIGIYKQKTGVDLEFYKLNSTNNRLTIALDGTDKIDFTLVEGNIDHANLGNLNSVNYTHLTAANHTDLTDGGDSALHYHSSDRARANHTGTQVASTVSDFSEAVDDRVNALIQNGTGITWTYVDAANTLTANCDLTWAELNKTISDIADITTKSHTSLTDIGTNTHAQIDTKITEYNAHDHSAADPTQVSHATLTHLAYADAGHTGFQIALGYVPSESSTSTNSIISLDSRNTNYHPDDRALGLYVDFKANATDGLSDGGTYHGVRTFRSYGSGADLSGGPVMQIANTENGNLWTRISTGATTWGSWVKIWNSAAFSSTDITNWGTAYTHSQDNTQAHSDYMLNTGDTATGNYTFDSPTFHIDSTNNRVGIGTTSPNQNLHIKKLGGDAIIRLENSDNNWELANPAGGYFQIFDVSNSKVPFLIVPNTPSLTLYLDSPGNVGIGTMFPNQKLTVEGTMSLKERASANTDTAAYGQIWVKSGTPNTLWFTDDAGTDHQIAFV